MKKHVNKTISTFVIKNDFIIFKMAKNKLCFVRKKRHSIRRAIFGAVISAAVPFMPIPFSSIMANSNSSSTPAASTFANGIPSNGLNNGIVVEVVAEEEAGGKTA
jgi:hypothetical protein